MVSAEEIVALQGRLTCLWHVFSNVTSPIFGAFDGFQRRLTGLDINLTE